MAKSLRSSSKKNNKAKLRTKVFAGAENARTERLSAKLMDLASKPKVDSIKDTDMEKNDTG
jgi:hypothetical protein